MSLGYKGQLGWRDMSEYVVHLTYEGPDLKAILEAQLIEATGPFGATRSIKGFAIDQRSACFSEIPLDYLERLVDRHGRWGVGFEKKYLLPAGGGRVWYVDRGFEPASTVFDMVKSRAFPPDQSDPIWRLTPFIDYVQSGSDPGSVRYQFDWEREWRVPGGLSFLPAGVAFLFAPGWKHDGVRDWCQAEGFGHVRLIDPLWGEASLQAALASLSSGGGGNAP